MNNITFKYTYRPYQQKVLDEVEKYIDDGKIHIVAAPGAGKTIVALSLIFKICSPTLILVPTIAIREQWVERMTQDFTSVDLSSISTSLKEVKRYTVVTYQALYEYKPEVIKEILLINKIKLIVFDEAHHLRNAWFNHISKFINEINGMKTISLTATPPYDDKKLYGNYIELCGEIDTEVNVPELVANNNLCPHQDYIYFNSISKEEESIISEYRKRALSLAISFLNEELFIRAIATHRFFVDFKNNTNEIIEYSYAFKAMIKLLRRNGIIITKEIEKMSTKELEISIMEIEELFKLVFLEKDPDFKIISKVISKYKNIFTKIGAINKNSFNLLYSNTILKNLNENIGKLNSINEIILHEKSCLNDKLKMIVVTDFIKNYKNEYDEEDENDCQIGVIPIFNNIREKIGDKVKCAVLTGSIVLIPQELKEKFINICDEENIQKDKLSIKEYDISFDFLEVKLGSNEKTVKVITRLFKESDIDVLVGTNALIGEGWDAPFVNSLIIASNISTYISSNQIRGRVIRIDPDNKEKVANIWHLITIEGTDFNKYKGVEYEKISMRLGHIEGLSLSKPQITNGIQRFEEDIEEIMTEKNGLQKLNDYMKQVSCDRKNVKEKWMIALKEYEKTYTMPVSGRINKKILEKKLSTSTSNKTKHTFAMLASIGLVTGFSLLVVPYIMPFEYGMAVYPWVALFDSYALYRFSRNINRDKESIYYILLTVIRALKYKKLINTTAYGKIIKKDNNYYILCNNVDVREQMLVKKCMEEALSNNVETRYMIKTGQIIYSVPSIFDKTKETAEKFFETYKSISSNKKAKLIYSKGIAGKIERLKIMQKEDEEEGINNIKLDNFIADAEVLKEMFDENNKIEV